ncbi:amino acid permease-associated region [Trichinella spiralis]|uniref:amino acid permease-associated region n=1 Tax=Trichinella spiralis TaxID=6334 RepID=UPI0001EFEC35|nr:amino acid permease-associated region [Trichinella spiralis]
MHPVCDLNSFCKLYCSIFIAFRQKQISNSCTILKFKRVCNCFVLLDHMAFVINKVKWTVPFISRCFWLICSAAICSWFVLFHGGAGYNFNESRFPFDTISPGNNYWTCE